MLLLPGSDCECAGHAEQGMLELWFLKVLAAHKAHSPLSNVVPALHRQSSGELLPMLAVVLLVWHAKSSPPADQEPTGAGVQADDSA